MDREYFQNLKESQQLRNSSERQETEPEKKSQKRKILDLMLERFPGWVRNDELNYEICFRYGGRICELRKDGWEIENIPVPGTNRKIWQCRLLKPFNPKKQVPEKLEKGEIFEQNQVAFNF